MPKTIYMSELGAKFDGTSNDTQYWIDAINILNDNNGGVIIADMAGASVITAPLPALKKDKATISIMGYGKLTTKLQFQGFLNEPCISFVQDNKDLEGFSLQNIGIRHTQGATLFQSTNGRFKDCLINNVFFGQATDSSSTNVIITGGLKSTLRGVTVNGGNSGGVGLDFSGTHCLLDGIFAPDKGTSPSNFIKAKMVNGSIQNCRTEGGNGDADYYLQNCDHVVMNTYAEGHQCAVGILLENCNGVKITGATGVQAIPNPVGIKFISTSYCEIDGFKMSAGQNNLIFDATSNYNTVRNLRVIKTNFSTQKVDIFDSGQQNSYTLAVDTTESWGTRLYRS